MLTQFQYCQILLLCFSSKFIANGNDLIKHEFKIVIEPGGVDYFYQKVDLDAVFHVSFQVIRKFLIFNPLNPVKNP